jgi:hypothetical protein
MNTTDLNLEIASSAGEVIGQLSYDDQGSATQEITLTCPADDWFTVTLSGTELPIAGSPFIITTTYTAPKGV